MTGAHKLPARNGLHAPAALPRGDPDRSAAPHGPADCLLDGLPSLSRSGVKGRCALMSARWAFGPPLTPPRPGWAGATGRPERARSSARPAASGRCVMREETTPEDEQRLEAEHLAWIAKAEAVLEHIVTTSFRPRTQDQADDHERR